MQPELYDYEIFMPVFEALCELLGRRATAGQPMPTTIDLSPYAYSILVRHLDAKVQRADDFSFITLATPFAYVTVRWNKDVTDGHALLGFDNFDRIRAYETFELMERVATELMERAAKLRDALNGTATQ